MLLRLKQYMFPSPQKILKVINVFFLNGLDTGCSDYMSVMPYSVYDLICFLFFPCIFLWTLLVCIIEYTLVSHTQHLKGHGELDDKYQWKT